MRDLDECKAEIFRISEKRIKERKEKRLRFLTLCVSFCLIVTACTSLSLLGRLSQESGHSTGNNGAAADGTEMFDGSDHMEDGYMYAEGSSDESMEGAESAESADFGSFGSFAFSLTWGCGGISSYDSKTGVLVKAADAAKPDDYRTVCQLTEEQKRQIFNLIREMDLTNYPDFYDPYEEKLATEPSMTLILEVSTDRIQKTVTAKDIALTYESDSPAGQRFLDVCKAIEDILTKTEEWKALPEYESLYD